MTGEIYKNIGKEPYLFWCDTQAKFSAPDQQDGNILRYGAGTSLRTVKEIFEFQLL